MRAECVTGSVRAALVVGGSSGIGKAVVQLLNARGWYTINLDRQIDSDPPNQQHSFIAVDLADEQGVLAATREISGTFGHIDGMALLAGIGSREEKTSQGTEHFERQITANLLWQHKALHAITPLIRDGGAVVLTSSTTILYGESDLGYVAAKAGIAGLGKGLALALARRKIRVNVVAPGPIDTPMLRSVTTGAERAMLRTFTPLGRLGEPLHVANTILFFLDDGSAHITGQMLVIDGGLSIAYRPVL